MLMVPDREAPAIQKADMKTLLVVLVVGAAYSGNIFGQNNSAEERFHMKYGRYTAAEEARRKGAAPVSVVRPVAPTGAPADQAGNEERFRMKMGRHTTSEEVRIAAAKAKDRSSGTAVADIAPSSWRSFAS